PAGVADGTDAPGGDADVQRGVDAPSRVENPAAGEREVGHESRPAGRRASVAANAATVRSTSASVCAALRKPDPWKNWTPSSSRPACSSANSPRLIPAHFRLSRPPPS